MSIINILNNIEDLVTPQPLTEESSIRSLALEGLVDRIILSHKFVYDEECETYMRFGDIYSECNYYSHIESPQVTKILELIALTNGINLSKDEVHSVALGIHQLTNDQGERIHSHIIEDWSL